MTLLVTVFAAITATIVWYLCDSRRELKLGFLSLMFWGASLMWFVDAFFEYAEQGAQYFTPAGSDMLNAFFLGLCVVALGCIIWLISLLVSDPRGVVRNVIKNSK